MSDLIELSLYTPIWTTVVLPVKRSPGPCCVVQHSLLGKVVQWCIQNKCNITRNYLFRATWAGHSSTPTYLGHRTEIIRRKEKKKEEERKKGQAKFGL
jgi:hypothetical protein